jgi:hypothetical protein
MIQLTLGQARGPIASVAGVSGMPVTSALVTAYVNAAVAELMNEGEWPNVVDRWHLTVPDGNVVLPGFLDQLMQINIAGVPQTIASPWWQFVAYGPGTREDQPSQDWGVTWCDERMISDRGEYPVQVALPETGGPWNFRVYTAVDETIVTNGTAATPSCTIQGTGSDGRIIRTQVGMTNGTSWINGEQVELNYAVSYVQTVNQFATISAFTKPVTNGYVKITAWDGTVETVLADYEPGDTTPSYHHYFSQWLNDLVAPTTSCLRVIRARCRKRYVPACEDTDILLVSNVGALQEMVIAQWKRKSDNLESYAAHKQTAVALMTAEANSYRGKSRIPGITFQRGFGVTAGIPKIR